MERSLRQGPIPYYGASGIIDSIDDYIFDGRYLLIAEDGENLNSRKLPIAFFADGRFWVNNHAHVVRGKSGMLDDVFLQQWFAQANISGFVTGAAQPKLSQANLRLIKIPIPPLQLQRKIGAILSTYDDLIENNNLRISILEEITRRIYHEWFVEFRYPGYDGVPTVDSAWGRIPEGWTWKELRELAVECRDAIDPDTLPPETPYVGLEQMPERSIALAEWGRAGDAGSRKYRFNAGDVLFGKIRPYFHKVVVPPVAGICSTDAIVIRQRAPEFSSLVLAVVSSDAFVQQAVQTSQGTKMPRANWAVLERYPVPVPPPQLHQLFQNLVGDAVALVERLVLSTRALKECRDLLLPRLISDEIDVSGLDIAMPPTAA